MFGFGYLKLAGFAAVAIAIWIVSGWGFQVIDNYTKWPIQIAKLEREAALRDSRLESKQTIIDRQKAAIDQSQCKARIQYLLKNPDLLKKQDPFSPGGGG